MTPDLGRVFGVDLAQHQKVGVAGVHAQDAGQSRVQRVVDPGLVDDPALLRGLAKMAEGGIGPRLGLGRHVDPDVRRDVLPDVAHQRHLDHEVQAGEMGVVPCRQTNRGIDAPGAAPGVIDVHQQILVWHRPLPPRLTTGPALFGGSLTRSTAASIPTVSGDPAH